jgi:hypothetical protein
MLRVPSEYQGALFLQVALPLNLRNDLRPPRAAGSCP